MSYLVHSIYLKQRVAQGMTTNRELSVPVSYLVLLCHCHKFESECVFSAWLWTSSDPLGDFLSFSL